MEVKCSWTLPGSFQLWQPFPSFHVRKSAGSGLLLLFHTPFTQGASASADRLSWPHNHGNPHTSCRADPKLSERRFARATASFIDIRNIGGHRPPPDIGVETPSRLLVYPSARHTVTLGQTHIWK